MNAYQVSAPIFETKDILTNEGVQVVSVRDPEAAKTDPPMLELAVGDGRVGAMISQEHAVELARAILRWASLDPVR